MKPSFPSSLPVLSLLLGTLALVGCGGALNFPDSVPSAQASGPAIQGSVYGGHAPIQGAHVYLLQPGVTGYGSAATSLLGNNGATSASGYAITANVSDPNVPATAGAGGTEPKYEITDSTGSFNLTGGYTCTVGQPVYIYAWGGNIGTTSTSPVTTTTNYAISKIVVSNRTTGSGGTATYTVTIAAGATLTPHESVTVAGLTSFLSTEFTILNTAQTVVSVPTSTTFTFVASDYYQTLTGHANTNNGTYTTTTFGTGGTVAVTTTTSGTTVPPTQNNNIVQLATLGNCPSSGNFSTAGNGALSYVYLNEVSTVATAYTFQPFTLVTNNDAWHIGSSGTTQALLGISNAANTAAQLYNIQGGVNISSSGDGEGHLANTLTAATNGIVPEATIDSLANIIATCVDTVPTAVGTPTTQCKALFAIATDNGETTGTQPTDTGTAAINIARYPAGNGSSGNVDATYAADIFNLQTGTTPYVPQLSTAPNDWTIVINYPVSNSSYTLVSNPEFGLAESIAIDDLGQVWVTGQVKYDIVRLSPLGALSPTAQNTFSYIPGYVSLDGSNNAWTGNADSSSPIFEAGSNGVFTATYGTANEFNKAYVTIADNAGDVYFFANTSAVGGIGGTGGRYDMFEYPVGSINTTTPNDYNITSSITSGTNVAHGAIDSAGDFWLTTEVANGGRNGTTPESQIARVTSNGTSVFSFTVGQQPEFPAIDNNGNAWIPLQATTGEIYKVTPTGGSTILTAGTTGALLTSTFGSAVDGNGNVWVTNRCGNYGNCGTTTGENTIVEINGSAGANSPGTANLAISPSTNYIPEIQYPGATTNTAYLDGPLNVAIDPSGNVWITNYTGGGIIEMVGAAAPVTTPLSAAAAANKLGAKP